MTSRSTRRERRWIGALATLSSLALGVFYGWSFLVRGEMNLHTAVLIAIPTAVGASAILLTGEGTRWLAVALGGLLVLFSLSIGVVTLFPFLIPGILMTLLAMGPRLEAQ